MKRLFPVLLVLLLIPCLAVSASATTSGIIDAIEDQTDSLGEWLGIGFSDVVDGLLWIGDNLEWLDSTVRDVETAIIDNLKTGVDETLGEIVVGIKQAIENMNTNITSCVNYLRSIKTYVQQLVEGFGFEDDGVIDEAEEKQDAIDDITDTLETAPTINPDDIDSVISDVGDKFENITSDSDGGLIFAYFRKVADFEVFKELIPTSAMLGVLSFILFGKVF